MSDWPITDKEAGKMAYCVPAREQIIARLMVRYPWANETQVSALADDEMAFNERQKHLRPLTLHEVATRWYSYDKVVLAIAERKLRPNRRGDFDWLHVLAVDPGIARMHSRPHPDTVARAPRCPEAALADFKRLRLAHRLDAQLDKEELPIAVVPPPDGLTCIYFLEAIGTGRCKIGKADSIDKRLRSHQCSSPVPLRLMAYMHGPPKDEGRLHRQFKAERVQGEWFLLSPRLRKFISRIRLANPVSSGSVAA